MKYFLDTEFLEGTQKEKFPISLFRKNTPPTIDLISIGIVAEDGREYYAISKDFNLEEAWNRFDIKQENIVDKQMKLSCNLYSHSTVNKKVYWIRENVLKPIWIDLFLNYEAEHTFLKGIAYDLFEQELKAGTHDKLFTFKSFKALVNRYGKTNKEIAEEVKKFCKPLHRNYSLDGDKRFTHGSLGFGEEPASLEEIDKYDFKFNYPKSNPEFYAYYADYDWVVFCWLFGKMMDLPTGFPMYCRDLIQLFHDKTEELIFSKRIKFEILGTTEKQLTSEEKVSKIKQHPDFPKQDPSKSHNAIEDARWNKQLFDFLNTI